MHLTSSEIAILVIAGVLLIILVGGFFAFAMYVQGNIKRSAKPVSPPSNSKALEIAKERYARGEITRDQFEQIRKDLS